MLVALAAAAAALLALFAVVVAQSNDLFGRARRGVPSSLSSGDRPDDGSGIALPSEARPRLVRGNGRFAVSRGERVRPGARAAMRGLPVVTSARAVELARGGRRAPEVAGTTFGGARAAECVAFATASSLPPSRAPPSFAVRAIAA